MAVALIIDMTDWLLFYIEFLSSAGCNGFEILWIFFNCSMAPVSRQYNVVIPVKFHKTSNLKSSAQTLTQANFYWVQ